jgi:polysaccharide transporter, PST family
MTGPGSGGNRFVTLGDEGLRQRAARGTVVNGVFLVGVNALGFLKGFVVAAFLPASDYGVWGLLVITLGTLIWIAQVGVDDKYIQQDDSDQEIAFQQAFTIQAAICGMFVLVVLVTMPLFALAYGTWEIVAPAYVLSLAMIGVALQTPLWAHYRRMDFVRQRTVQAFDPVVSFVLTVTLAIAGLGYWALVLGTLAGAWGAGIAALRSSPYPIKFRIRRGVLREYASFSWPLFVQGINGVLIAQIPVLIAQRHLGLAAVGAIALASTISLYAARVDEIVTHAIYPAVCAVKQRTDVLFETFTKSNRLALLWGVPCGVGIALFTNDLVHYVIGDRWVIAITAIQVFGLAAALNQIGFNWSVFYRARGETRPIAIASGIMLACVLAFTVPLIFVDGVDGFAIGMGVSALVMLIVRSLYLFRLFPTLNIVIHSARAIAPTVPAVVLVLAMRQLEGARTPAAAIVEVALFLAVVAGATLLFERALVREFVGYVRRRAPSPVVPVP